MKHLLPVLVLLCFFLGRNNVHAETTCLIHKNTEQCNFLMSSLMMGRSSSCDCYDFCNGIWMGCGSSTNSSDTIRRRSDASSNQPATGKCENGKWVRGCTIATLEPIESNHHNIVMQQQPQNEQQQQQQRSLQTSSIPIVVVTASTEGCQAGFFRSDPSSLCVPCLSCGTNAFAKVTCVTYRPDPNQCECNPGYQPNIRNTGCLPIRTSTTDSPISSPMVAPSPPITTTNNNNNNTPPPTVGSRPISSTTISNRPITSPPSSNRPIITNPPVGSPSTPLPINQSPTTITTSNGQTDLICPVGFFKSSPEATSPCIPCLSCGLNAFAKIDCVTYRPDPNQCECNPGYQQNVRRTGCLPVREIGGGSIDDDAGNNNNNNNSSDCPVGFFKSSPEVTAPCIPCLSCGLYAFAKTNCVTYRPDLNQCECNPGYQPNIRRTGCLPVANNNINSTTIAGGGSIDGNNNNNNNNNNVCPMGMFKSSPEASSPCIPCLSCGLNAFAKVTCVTYRPDPNQCECNAGFTPNIRRTGCLPIDSTTSTATAESVEMGQDSSNAGNNNKVVVVVSFAGGTAAALLLGATILHLSW